MNRNAGTSLPLDPQVSHRISALRYLLIVGIVLLHVPPYVPLAALPDNPSAFELFKAFVQNGLFRLAVPILSCISGYMMFLGPPVPYPSLLRKKCQTLLVPHVLWNGVALVALLIVGWRSGGSASPAEVLPAYPFNLSVALDGLIGITSSNTWNYPLNFLRDLMVLIVLTPVLRLLLTSAPWPGLLLWSVVFLLNLDGGLVSRPAMPVTYAVGALAAWQGWDLKRLDRWAPWTLLVLLAAAAAIVHFRAEDRRYVGLLAPLLAWPASALLVRVGVAERLAQWSDASFFIFLSHALVLKALDLAVAALLPVLPALVHWLILAVGTLCLCHVAFALGQRLFPAAAALVTGGRVSAPRQPA